MTVTAIEATGLTKSFGDVAAVDHLDLTVNRGSICAILGPNGAGKSTTIGMLTTVVRPDAGTASVFGFDTVSQADQVRARIGLANQRATVDDDLTGWENLYTFGRLTHMPASQARRQAQDLLDLFGLANVGDRLAGTYSGGMRRRLDLAAALVHRPPVLVLDEPTTGLDPVSRSDLWRFVGEYVEGGRSVLLSTQYLEEADRLADHVVVLRDGVVVGSGSPDRLKALVATSSIVVSFSATSEATVALDALKRVEIRSSVVDGASIAVRCDDTTNVLTKIVRALDDAGTPPSRIDLNRPTLDDVFVRLTEGESSTGLLDEADSVVIERLSVPSRATIRLGDAASLTVPPHQAPDPEPTSVDTVPMPLSPVDRSIRHVFSDGLIVTKRNVLVWSRVKEALFAATVQPIMLMLLFRFVFSGAVQLDVDRPYVAYLVPGILVHAVAFSAAGTSIAMAYTVSEGFVERFRSLPMAQSAVLVGRAGADLVRNLFILSLMLISGYLIGFRADGGIGNLALAFLVILSFGFALSWAFATLGLLIKDPEAAQLVAITILFPFTFASSAFVTTESLAAPIRLFAENQPVSAVVDATRALVLGDPSTTAVQAALAWSAAIAVVFMPLAGRLYRRLR